MIDGVSFKVGSTTHVLRLTTMAMVRLETTMNMKINNLVVAAAKGFSAQFLLAAFAAGLNDGKGMDMEEAAAVLDEFGGVFGGAGPIVADALSLALPPQPDPVPEPGDGAGADPAPAKEGAPAAQGKRRAARKA